MELQHIFSVTGLNPELMAFHVSVVDLLMLINYM